VVNLGVDLTEAARAQLEAMGTIVVPQDAESADAELSAMDDRIVDIQIRALRAGDTSRTLFYAGLDDHSIDPFVQPRAAAYVRVCHNRGVEASGTLLVPLELGAAVEAITTAVGHGPVGFACYNDEVAMAILAAARELQLEVPGEIAVVGVDGTKLGQLWSPRLTSVRIEVEIIADRLALMLQKATGKGTASVVGMTSGPGLATLLPGHSC
jgi:DNA-binding LacI/PurR family transcriptional regulator